MDIDRTTGSATHTHTHYSAKAQVFVCVCVCVCVCVYACKYPPFITTFANSFPRLTMRKQIWKPTDQLHSPAQRKFPTSESIETRKATSTYSSYFRCSNPLSTSTIQPPYTQKETERDGPPWLQACDSLYLSRHA